MILRIHAARRGIGQACLAFCALSASPVAAQIDTIADATAPEPLPAPPIVVIGDGDPDEAGRGVVTAGSRLPQQPIFADGVVATNSGTPGLVPQSGMDPAGGYVRLRKRTVCTAEDPAIGKEVACILIAAAEARERGDSETLRGLLLPVALEPVRADAERRAAALLLWQDANAAGDPRRVEEALETLIASTTLTARKESQAWQSLARLSADFGNSSEERERLERAAEYPEASPQALARLAIVQRQDGDERARATMARAVAAIEQSGRDVPPGWREFAAAD